METQAKKPFFHHIINQSAKPVLVDFWAPWCGPCKQIAPIVDEIAESYGGQIELAKVNVDEYPELAAAYRVMGLPTLMMFKNGQPVDALAGGVSRSALVNFVNSALKAA